MRSAQRATRGSNSIACSQHPHWARVFPLQKKLPKKRGYKVWVECEKCYIERNPRVGIGRGTPSLLRNLSLLLAWVLFLLGTNKLMGITYRVWQ